MRSYCVRACVPVVLLGLSVPSVHAEDEHIVAHGQATALRSTPVIGGRLGLTVQHNPATINIITRSVMDLRGIAHADEAADSAPGVTSGGSPGNPAQLMMRGFTAGQVLVLRDGIYYGPTTMVNRPLNTFNLENVQVLKGPSSVLYGQGAVGGTVDIRTRDPVFDAAHANALVSYGSFNTWNAGVGGSIPLSSTFAIRADFSRTSSAGYVQGANPHSNDLTVTALWRPNADFSARLGVDYLTDRLSTYYGAPLVPLRQTGDAASGLLTSSQGLGLTRSELWKYYNVSDAKAGSVNATPTLHLDWQVNPHLALHNKSYVLYAKRDWNNAETYSFIGNTSAVDAAGQSIAAGRIGRDRFYVYQNQHQVVDTVNATFDHTVFGIKNRLVLGGDAYYLRFIRNRGFPDADYADSVSMTAPQGGSLGPFEGELPYRKSPTTMTDAAVFLEDVVTVWGRLRIVGGYRYDWLHLDRQNYNQNGAFNAKSSFQGHYNPSNFRIGPVYDITPAVSVYGVFSTAEDPPGANLFIANRGQFSALSHTTQGEVGTKATLLNGRANTTLALYNIDRRQILVATGPDTVANAGRQVSRGVEWEGNLALTHHVSLSGNVAYTDSHFGSGFMPSAGMDASGHQVPNVPRVTANMWGVWSRVGDLPLDLGAGMRYVSARQGDYANTITLHDYATVNVFAGWHMTKNVTVYGRIDNIGNKYYVQWADPSYPGQVLMGAPRSFSMSIQAGL